MNLTLDERIAYELARVKPEFTVHEWYALQYVIEGLIRRLLTCEAL